MRHGTRSPTGPLKLRLGVTGVSPPCAPYIWSKLPSTGHKLLRGAPRIKSDHALLASSASDDACNGLLRSKESMSGSGAAVQLGGTSLCRSSWRVEGG